jgi:hypothetical protein
MVISYFIFLLGKDSTAYDSLYSEAHLKLFQTAALLQNRFESSDETNPLQMED